MSESTIENFYHRVAGKPFRPSNGAEGESFRADYCDRCAKDYPVWRNRHDAPCTIPALTMTFNVTDPHYPREWIYASDGSGPTCTAFEAE